MNTVDDYAKALPRILLEKGKLPKDSKRYILRAERLKNGTWLLGYVEINKKLYYDSVVSFKKQTLLEAMQYLYDALKSYNLLPQKKNE